ncbi:MAG: C25 family cysteine peptidase, partial [Planctomycetota bacterium]
MRRHLRSRNPVAKATRRSKRETRKSPRRASTLPRPGRGRPPKRGFWSCRFEPLEDRFLLSVAPGVDNTLSSSDDALFLPVGSAGSYAEESQWVSNSAPVGVFTGGAESQTAVFDFSFDGTPILQDVAGGAIVTLAGEESWVSTGDPVMPVRESTILLPVGMEITSIDVTYLDTGTVIADGVELLAAPAALPFSEGGVEAINDWTTLVNTSFHEQDAVLYSNYTISGYHVGTLRIFPMEYDAAAGTLSYHTEVSVMVTVGAAEDGGNVSVRGSEADHLRVAALVDNPEALSDYPLPAATSGGESPMLPAAGQYDYVIVTSSALEASFQPLVNQKIARGLTATTVSTETIYANYSGTETGDNADRIRHFIADAYANWGTQWVLLGGDAEVLPQRAVYASVGSTVDTALPTDLYYAALDGTWNGDGDNLWGESNDGTGGGDIDLVPEVYIGRAPVSNTTEAGNFVSKTIRYETTPHANATTAVWLGEQLDSGTWGSYSAIPIRDQSIPDDWNLIERYDSAGGWTGSDFVGDLNASPHLVTHLGHSNETYNARLVNSYVAGLTNVDPYLMYSQGCYSGAFDTHNISIAEQHVVDDHGAFGVVMNTRYGWYMPGSTPGASHYYAREFWDAAFNEGHSHLGEVAQDAKDDNMFRVGSTGVYRWIHFTSTLFGDPETPLQIGGGPSAGGEIHGAVAEDANADGQRQVGETGLAGHTVFLDLDDDGARDVGTVTTALTGAPGTLVDNGTLTSTIVVSGAALVTDLNVSLDITHTYDGDLEVYLISPSGTKVELFTAVGGWGDNFTGTTLDDEAASPISGAAAPFTGTFRPEGLLSTFDGENANGAWTLEITDTASWDTGTLNNWSLEIAVEEPHTLTGADGTYAFLGLADGTYSVRYELPGGWSHTGPVDGLHSVAATGGGIVTGVDFLAVNNPPAIDLGAVDFHEIEALDLTGGDSWYSLQTTRQGYLTLEALFQGLPGDVEMKLYDEGVSELATSAVSDGGERIDWTVGAGQTYYLSLTGGAADVDLRLANLVHWDGASVFVYGTAADDRLDFAAAAWHQVTINGVHYEFDASVVNSVRFDGGAGRDTAVLLGSSGDDTAVLHPSWAALTGPGYRAVVTDTADIIVMGQGGTDVAKLYDSAGDDTFVATPRYGSLYGDGFYNRAVSFRYVHAFATGGGTDVAKLYDSAGDDTFVATPRDGSLYGDGFYNRAVSFRYVHAFASEGNSDVAKLYDDPGTADIFIADRHSSRLYGEGFYNRAKGFRYVHAFSSGGDDVATLHDDPTGDDTFLATARDCRL